MNIDPKHLNKYKIVPGAHELQEIIGEIMEMDNKSLPYAAWAGLTRDLSHSRIRELIRRAKTGRNPIALFKYLLAKERE